MVKVKQVSVEDKLVALFKLQSIHSNIDKIKILRGELPLEVQDLEDEIAGLETRLSNYNNQIDSLQSSTKDSESMIINSKELISKYNDQLKKIRNNREFDSLNKEIEFQDLEIQLSEKKIKEFKLKEEEINTLIIDVTEKLKERKEDLKIKNVELDKIISETKKDEEKLLKDSSKAEKVIDDRLLTAYSRLRKNFKNGLAVVKVNRNACGGCFNTVPPQRQMDIASHKKIIVCEHCGRILIDEAIAGEKK
ncbi:MAG: hypothetical protein CMD07_05600 [Flavobacteriales bacterium]|nr:hypothetical protein [Flavobacteriales bacterium]|tara:strand:- start:212 stop:961 length:750 start_codon:yes stop_codon:yes gene_type:complete